MPFVTIFFNERAFKVQESVATRLLRLIDIFAHEYTSLDAIKRLKSFKNADKIVKNIKNHPSIEADVFRILDDMVLNHRQVIEDYLGNIELPAMDNSTISIPDEFKHVSNIDSEGIGKGEALLTILLKNDIEWLPAGDAYDFKIDGQMWHFKDHRNTQSTPMGRPKGSEEFYETSIMQFIKSLGINVFAFGTDDFKDKVEIENALIKRYNLQLEDAARAFENELHSTFQASKCVEGSVGVLYLENDDNGKMLIKRINANSIMFHSNSGRGFKACCIKDRFVDSILSRTRRLKAIEKENVERQARKIARETAAWHLKQGQDIAKQFLNVERKVIKAQRESFNSFIASYKKLLEKTARENERLNNLKEFCDAAKECSTIVELSHRLNISNTTAQNKKKEAIKLGFEFRLKQKEVKSENRNRRRSSKTLHEGALGVNQASIA